MALINPIAVATTLRGRVSVGNAQNGPNDAYTAPTATDSSEKQSTGDCCTSKDPRNAPPERTKVALMCARRSHVLSELLAVTTIRMPAMMYGMVMMFPIVSSLSCLAFATAEGNQNKDP